MCAKSSRTRWRFPGCTSPRSRRTRGAEGAFEAGVHKLTLPVSVTEAHSLANIRKTPAQMIDEVRAIVALRNERFPSVQIEAGVSVAFGCTIAGAVSDDETIAMAVAMAECGVDEIGLSDTSGYANPAQVRRLFLRLQREVGDKAGGAHFPTRAGRETANVVAALDAGVTTIDARGAASAAARMRRVRPATSSPRISCSCSRRWDSTRVSTSTRCSRAILHAALPAEALYGHVPDAGLPKGFRYADGRAPSAVQPEGCLTGVAQ